MSKEAKEEGIEISQGTATSQDIIEWTGQSFE